MNKIYSRINWVNKPSIETPLNEQSLNRMDVALNALDNRVISQDTIKADKIELNDLVSDWTMDEETGIITITKVSGEKILFDLNIEKIPVGFSLSDDGILTMTTDDGTEFTADIGAMIPVLTFADSDEIAVSVSGSGVNKTYSFSIKTGSVTEDKLQPNYLADIKVEAAKAEASKNSAAQSAEYAAESAEEAKEYMEQSQEIYENFQKAGNVVSVNGKTGVVNIVPSDIGLGNVDNTADADKFVKHAENSDNASMANFAALDLDGNMINDTYLTKTGDTKNNTTTFVSEDSANPSTWSNVSVLSSEEKHSSIFNKISTMFKNVRYIYKTIGTTEISSIGDGTVTGAINTINKYNATSLGFGSIKSGMYFHSATLFKYGRLGIIHIYANFPAYSNGETLWLLDIKGATGKDALSAIPCGVGAAAGTNYVVGINTNITSVGNIAFVAAGSQIAVSYVKLSFFVFFDD